MFTIFLWWAQAVYTGHAGDNDDIPAFDEGAGSRVAQSINLFIYCGIFFYIGIAVGDVGFRLVIIIVADKILHGVFREKLLEFAAELGGQSLVVGNHQSRPLHVGNDVGNGKGLAGACYPQ